MIQRWYYLGWSLFIYLFTDLPIQKHYKDITKTLQRHYKDITKTLQRHYKDITKTLQIDITIRTKVIWQEIPHRD